VSASPNWFKGYVPPTEEWNLWWSRKLDNTDPLLTGGPWLSLSGGTMTGPVYLSGDPTDVLQAATKGYVDAHSGSGGGSGFLPLSGGTMLGPLSLAADPVVALGATTKQYVDGAVTRAGGPFLPLSGGALTGNVSSTTTTLGDQLNLTKNYNATMTGFPHQTVNTANITVPCAQELWNNFDDVNYNVTGGTDASSGTHVVARYTQVRKYTRSVNVPSMAFIASVVDFTNQRSSVAGPLTGYELDLECAGPDDQTAFGPNGSRVGMTMNFYPARGYAGNDSQVNAAYAVFGDTSRVSFKRLFNASAAWSVAALDLSQGVQLTNASTILMSAGMRVRFAPLRDIFWDTTLFSGAGGFHMTGKVEMDELLYAPAGITAGGPITLAGNTTISGTLAANTIRNNNASITFVDAATSAYSYYTGNVAGNTTETPETVLSGIVTSNDFVTTTGLIDWLGIYDQPAAGHTGARTAIHGRMNVKGSPAGLGSFYVSVQGDTWASVNAGGTGPAPAGNMAGAEFSSNLYSGATNWGQTTGVEVSAGIASGASAQYRVLVSLEANSSEAVRGSAFDAGISFNQDATTTPMLGHGIAFGHPGHKWYFAADSVLIGAVPRSLGVGGSNSTPMVADRGLDLSKVKFTTSAVSLPGFGIDPTGQVSIANAGLTRNATGLALDISRVLVTGAAVANGGTAYAVNDLVYELTSGTTLQVTSISGTGNGPITGLSIVVPGGLLSAAPGGPLPVSYGNGSGATVTLTTAARNALSVNPSGGPLGFYGATPVAKQIGVPITAAGIHAALTALGLIAP
jgi:hypothetical protein